MALRRHKFSVGDQIKIKGDETVYSVKQYLYDEINDSYTYCMDNCKGWHLEKDLELVMTHLDIILAKTRGTKEKVNA